METSWPKLKLKPDVHDMLLSTLTTQDPSERSKNQFEEYLKVASIPPSFTTLRWNTLIDEAENNLEIIRKTIEEKESTRGSGSYEICIHPILRDCILIKNQGPFHVKPVEKEVIVDHACGMAVLRGSDVFVPGILSMTQTIGSGDVVSVYADLEGRCLKGQIKPYSGERIFLGNGKCLVSRSEVFVEKSSSRGVGVVMTTPVFRSPRLSDLLPTHLVFPQNLPSIVCSCVLDPRPSELVLDMCCAPGGKTTHLATLMKNSGRLVAIDKSSNKMVKVEENLRAWSISNTEVYCHNSIDLHQPSSDVSGPPPYPSECFDRILLDAPCSALGQRPALVNPMSASQLRSHPDVQRKLLSTAVGLLKEGGTLVYSTCTTNILEDEAMVAWCLKKFPELHLSRQVPHLGGTGRTCEGLVEDDARLLQLFLPDARSEGPDEDTIGFFIAKFVKAPTASDRV